MSIWNPENVRDVAESVGIANLSDEAVQALSRDIEYRLGAILEDAVQSMRHAQRNVLVTRDISQAIRVLDLEPLYGYESVRPLRFGEASIGPGQPLFYVEDEEMDLEKLINMPLPKVPREITLTAHWLAVEGVQPSIPQNPTATESRNQDLYSKGAGAKPHMAALTGASDTAVKPLVKHHVSKELLLYFERVCNAVIDENNEPLRTAAFSSLRSDPGLHQLIPYFVQFIAEKVTHNMRSTFILTQMMLLILALLDNPDLYFDPYAASIVPPVITCLLGRRLGDDLRSTAQYPLRELSASLLGRICQRYSSVSPTLKPRLARTCLKHFLDPNQNLGVHYGAVLGIQQIGGAEAVRALIVPNLKAYETLLQEDGGREHGPNGTVSGSGAMGQNGDEPRPSRPKAERDMVIAAIISGLISMEEDESHQAGKGRIGARSTANGHGHVSPAEEEEVKAGLREMIGSVITTRIFDLGRWRLAKAMLGHGMSF